MLPHLKPSSASDYSCALRYELISQFEQTNSNCGAVHAMHLRCPLIKPIEIQRRRGGELKPTGSFAKPIGVSLFLAVLQFLSRMKVLAYSHLFRAAR